MISVVNTWRVEKYITKRKKRVEFKRDLEYVEKKKRNKSIKELCQHLEWRLSLTAEKNLPPIEVKIGDLKLD